MSQAALFDSLTLNGKELEAYYTPDWLAKFATEQALRLHWISCRPSVLEPHAGGGAFLRALPEKVTRQALDVDANCWAVQQGHAKVGDFLATQPGDFGRVDLVLGNPPFSNAEQHIEHALTIAPAVVFVLPMSRLETPSRQALYRRVLRELWILPKRVWPGSRAIGVFAMARGMRGTAPAKLHFPF